MTRVRSGAGCLVCGVILGGWWGLGGAGAAAARPSQAASVRRLSRDAVVGLLEGQVAQERVATLAREHGIDFALTPEVELGLRRAGADDALIKALRALAPRSTPMVHSSPPPTLSIEVPHPYAGLFVDGTFIGLMGPEGRMSLSTLAPGRHRVRVTVDGYQAQEAWVNLVAGQTSSLSMQLAPAQPPSSGSALAAEDSSVRTMASETEKEESIAPPRYLFDRLLDAHTGWVTSVAFSADGRYLATASWDKTVKLWDVAAGGELATLSDGTKGYEALAFSPRGDRLATATADKTVELWDVTERTQAGRFGVERHRPGWVYSIAFSPDGRLLASGADEKTLDLWDVATGRLVRSLASHRKSVAYAAFSPDGRLLASAVNAKNIGLWDVATGRLARILSGHSREVYAVAFSPDGRLLASGGADRTVNIWDVATGNLLRTLTGNGGAVTTLAFSPEGRYLASGSWDKTARIWDTLSGNVMQTLARHSRPVYTVAFSPDGQYLASGSEDCTVALWKRQ